MIGTATPETQPLPPSTDKWAEWLLTKRYGGDAEVKRVSLEQLIVVRDKVLERAGVKLGETLLDVGTGDGLVAMGAMGKVGAEGRVIFSDISEPLLNVCKEFVTTVTAGPKCEFIVAGAEDLSAIPSETIDVITTRSVLIYVKDKPRALAEFYRLLKPGGRVSIFEPLSKLGSEFVPRKGTYMGYDVVPIRDLFEKVMEGSKKERDAQSTMGDFDDRDFVHAFRAAGFEEIHLDLELHIGPEPMLKGNWEAFYHASPNPLVSSLHDDVDRALTPSEKERFEAYLRPLVAEGKGMIAQALAYIVVKKH